ncbi:MAG: VanZ family protein [Thermoanaerobaculia bacterium]|nr:VanZ family protein [Thermoanaerobaculia bacterium]
MAIIATRHLPLALWTVFCTVLLLVPSDSFGSADEQIEALEEIGHAAVIAVLALLAGRSLEVGPRTLRRAAALGTAGAVVYAVATEALQELVPGRGWEGIDVVASVAGAAAGGLALLALRRLSGPGGAPDRAAPGGPGL